MIKILAVTLENIHLDIAELEISILEYHLPGTKSITDPLDLITEVCKINPAIIIIDDDLIFPNSLQVLKSIKRIKPKLPIIFLTSDNSIQLGHQVNLIGVKYYLIKPLSNNVLQEYLVSAIIQLNNTYK